MIRGLGSWRDPQPGPCGALERAQCGVRIAQKECEKEVNRRVKRTAPVQGAGDRL